MGENPGDVYRRLLEDRRARIEELERRHRGLGYVRLGVAGAAAVVVWVALATSEAFSIAWVLIPIAGFAALMVAHDRLLRRLELRRRSAGWLERGLARLAGMWAGAGERGERYLDPAHPYAMDLDLFGKGSLFELLSTGRTRSGEDTLAAWLLSPARAAVARARQEAIRELTPRVDLREDLAVVAEDARGGVDPEFLARWGAEPAAGERGFTALLWAGTVIGLAGLAALLCLLLESAKLIAPVPGAVEVFLVFLIANGWFLHRYRGQTEHTAAAVEKAAGELKLLTGALALLEREQFHTPLLAELRAGLETDGDPASHRLARLRRLTEMLDSRDHVLVRVLEIFVLWTPHIAARVEEWRRRSGPSVGRWLRAVGEIEALNSLAGHAYEHPGDVFPELLDGALPGGGSLEAEGMGHPLIAEERVVRNDLRIEPPLRVLIVSGSNMSGKSTLLRTLGVNVVLAQAGATVRARRLRLTPLALGASIRVSDSLENGISRFYAEILRLRQILELAAGGTTVLFLIDEFLHGTNSHDRRIGAHALVKGLVDRGAIGLITTHDLALAEIADELGERAANVHFEDSVEDGRMHFDYHMRPGVVRKSNAIELMRSVGLEV